MAFVAGQRVTIIPPSTMAGLHGIVQGPTEGLEAFTVRLDSSDSLFICPTKNLVSHHGRNDISSSDDEDEDAKYVIGQKFEVEVFGVEDDGYKVRCADGQLWLFKRVPLLLSSSSASASGTQVVADASLLHHWNSRIHMLETSSTADASKIAMLEERLEGTQEALESVCEDLEVMQGGMQTTREELTMLREQVANLSLDLTAVEGSITVLLGDV